MRLWRGRSTHTDAPTGTRFIPAPHVVSVVQDTDTALLDVQRERYYTLDEVGTRVWALLGEGAEVPAIVEQLKVEYDAPAEVIEADVRALLAELHKAALVRAI
jgi:hypothetical protein